MWLKAVGAWGRVAYLRRMRKCGDRSLSMCRVVSGWVPLPAALGLLEGCMRSWQADGVSNSRLCKALANCSLLAVAVLAGCGQEPQAPDPEAPSPPRPMWNPEHLKVVSCEDVPPVPQDEAVTVAFGGATAILVWNDGTGSRSQPRQYMFRIKDPTCAERPDIQQWLRRP